MTLLSKEQILAVDDLVTEDVEVKEWGGTVRVRCLTGSERDDYEASLLIGKGKDREISLQDARARLVFLSLIDEEGNRMFTDVKDVKALGRKSAQALEKVFSVCQRLSGMRKEDMDDLLGNLETAPNDDSTSA